MEELLFEVAKQVPSLGLFAISVIALLKYMNRKNELATQERLEKDKLHAQTLQTLFRLDTTEE